MIRKIWKSENLQKRIWKLWGKKVPDMKGPKVCLVVLVDCGPVWGPNFLTVCPHNMTAVCPRRANNEWYYLPYTQI